MAKWLKLVLAGLGILMGAGEIFSSAKDMYDTIKNKEEEPSDKLDELLQESKECKEKKESV